MGTKVVLTTGDVLTRISAALDAADHEFGLMTDAVLLGATTGALVLADRMQAFALSLLAEIESRDTAHHELGIGTSTWLANGLRLTPREANRLIRDATDLARFTQVREGMLNGTISVPQSQAVTRVLTKLPDDLGVVAEQAAEATMVEYCAEFNSDALKRLSRHLVEVVAPEIAD